MFCDEYRVRIARRGNMNGGSGMGRTRPTMRTWGDDNGLGGVSCKKGVGGVGAQVL